MFQETPKKATPMSVLYELFSEAGTYSIVISNVGHTINPKTFQNRVYDYRPDGSVKKQYKTEQPCGVYAQQVDYTSGDGIAGHPTLSFSTPNDIYKGMDITDKAPLNALKTFCNERPVVVAWHNGTVNDECRCNGFHTHVIAHSSVKLWHDQAWRTCRSKLCAGGASVRTQSISNLPGIVNYISAKPRVVAGSNKALFCSKLIKYKNSTPLSDTELLQVFKDDEAVSDAPLDEGGQSGIIADLLGWQEKSSVSTPSTTKTSTVSIADYIKSLTQTDTGDNTDRTIYDICRTKTGPTGMPPLPETNLPETKTVKKIGVLRELIEKYSKFTQQDLLRAIIRSGDPHDIKNYRVLKTSPNFSTIWNQVIAEISAEKAERGSTYLDSYLNHPNDAHDTLTKAETASLFLEWCKLQQIDAAQFMRELFTVLSCSLPKLNTFALIGQSNAGKSYWMNCIAILRDLVGETISSADFMWQECIDKDLVYIPECTLSKPDQLEIFKKVTEGMPTTVNIKNKMAQTLNRTPVILTSNTTPWELFQQEREAICNRLFLYNVREAPMLKNAGDPNPEFFRGVFKFTQTYILTDDSWPYESGSENTQLLDDSLTVVMEDMASEAVQTFSLLVEFESDPDIQTEVLTMSAIDELPELDETDFPTDMVKHVKMILWKLTCGADDSCDFGIKLDAQNKLTFTKAQGFSMTMNTTYLATLSLLNKLKGWSTLKCDGMTGSECTKVVLKSLLCKIKTYFHDLMNSKRVQFKSPEDSCKRKLNFVSPQLNKKPKTAPIVECDGCRIDAPGQQSHMGMGGCLNTVVLSDSD